MRREPPDSRFYAEIRDLNLAFLELVSAGRHRRHGTVFGLDSAVVDQIGRLDAAQLEGMAMTPCLLAGFAAPRGGRLQQRVAEPPPAGDPEWTGQAGLFAAGLLTYVWQTARRDSLRAALCAGSAAGALGDDLHFADIRAAAARAVQHLEARFLSRARFWPDLVRAARDRDAEHLRLARLTAIQLATSETAQALPLAMSTPRCTLLRAGMR